MGMMKTLLIKVAAALTVTLGMAALIALNGLLVTLAWNEALAPVLNLATKMDILQGSLIWVATGSLFRKLVAQPQARARVTNAPREWPPTPMQTKAAAPGAISFEEALKRARANAAENAKKRTGSSGNGA